MDSCIWLIIRSSKFEDWRTPDSAPLWESVEIRVPVLSTKHNRTKWPLNSFARVCSLCSSIPKGVNQVNKIYVTKYNAVNPQACYLWGSVYGRLFVRIYLHLGTYQAKFDKCLPSSFIFIKNRSSSTVLLKHLSPKSTVCSNRPTILLLWSYLFDRWNGTVPGSYWIHVVGTQGLVQGRNFRHTYLLS